MISPPFLHIQGLLLLVANSERSIQVELLHGHLPAGVPGAFGDITHYFEVAEPGV